MSNSSEPSMLGLQVIYAEYFDRCVYVSAAAIVVYDTIINMDKEVAHFWRARWSLTKFIYFFVRYLGLLLVTVSTWKSIDTNVASYTSCLTVVLFQTLATSCSVLAIETILMIRVYALYEKSRMALVLMAVLFTTQVIIIVFFWVLDAALIGQFDERGSWDPSSCLTTSSLNYANLFIWLPPVLVDFCLLVASVRKASKMRNTVQDSNWSEFPIIKTLIRDQVLYFIGVFLCGILAIISNFTFTVGTDAGIATFGIALPCVMGCRILLNLREAAYKQSGAPTLENISTLRFAQRTTRQRTVRSTLTPHEAYELCTRR